MTRSQPGVLFGAVVVTLFVLRGGNFLGIWMAMVVLDLYFLMTGFARARLQQAGIGFVSRAVVVAAMLTVAAAVTWQALLSVDLERLNTIRAGAAMTRVAVRVGEAFFQGGAGVLYFVPSLFARAVVSSTLPGFVTSSVILAALGIVCFSLAVRLDVSFEDASLEAARKRASRAPRERSWRRGQTILFRHTPPLFHLGETGRPEVAIVWKNLIAAGRVSLPVLVFPLAALVVVASGVGMIRGAENALAVAATVSLAFLAILSFVGPLVFRNDLRSEIGRLDQLRVLPAEGIGRGIVLMLGHLLFFMVGLLPAALTFAVGFWLASFLFDYGPAAGTIAAVPASAILWLEIALMIQFLGARFDDIDIANDLEPEEA